MYYSPSEYENKDHYSALNHGYRGLDYAIEGYGNDCYTDGDSQDCSYNFGHHVGVVSADLNATPSPNHYACQPSGYQHAYKAVNAASSNGNGNHHHHHHRGNSGGDGGCLMLIIGLILLGLIMFTVAQFCGAKK